MSLQIEEAVKTLIEALKTDAEFREACKSSIAMAIYDEAVAHEEEEFYDKAIIEVANRGADRFLNMLCTVPKV